MSHKMLSKTRRYGVLDCIIFTQICFGGENVGKDFGVWKTKKCCKLLPYSTLLFVETSFAST